MSTKLSVLKGHIKTKKHADGIERRYAKEVCRKDIAQALVVHDESHPHGCCFIKLCHKKCLRIIGKRFGNNREYFGEILERIIGNCMRIIGLSLPASSSLLFFLIKSSRGTT